MPCAIHLITLAPGLATFDDGQAPNSNGWRCNAATLPALITSRGI